MFDDPITVAEHIASEVHNKYISINLEWLTIDRGYEFDLYQVRKGQYILFCRKHLILTKAMTHKLKKGKTLYVSKSEQTNFQTYMEENIGSIINDKSKKLEEKSEAVYSVSTNLVHDLLEAPKAAGINKVKDMVSSQIDYVMKNPGAVNSLMSITEHDYYTYTHSVNVAIYLVGLGEQMKLSAEDIKLLSLGGMLHDLGKSKIPVEIINCKGKLSDEQFDTMKKHPEFGIELLQELDISPDLIPPQCHSAIIDHHEKHVGGGYPSKKGGMDIPLFGRMTKVCDVFDALTTKRSYKPEMTAFDALQLMKEKMTGEFDPEIFDQFLLLMADYSATERKKSGK